MGEAIAQLITTSNRKSLDSSIHTCANGGAQHLSDANLPRPLLGHICDEAEKTQAGDQDSQTCKDASQFSYQQLRG